MFRVRGHHGDLAAREPVSTAHLFLVSMYCCLNVSHVTASSRLSYDLEGSLFVGVGVNVEYFTANVSQSSGLMSHLVSSKIISHITCSP